MHAISWLYVNYMKLRIININCVDNSNDIESIYKIIEMRLRLIINHISHVFYRNRPVMIILLKQIFSFSNGAK